MCPDPTAVLYAEKQKYFSGYGPPNLIFPGTLWIIECQLGYTWLDEEVYKNMTCLGTIWSKPAPCICMNNFCKFHNQYLPLDWESCGIIKRKNFGKQFLFSPFF